MATLLAIVIGCLYAAGIYMMLRRSLFKLVLGLVLLSHGANLLIFTVGGLTRGRPPVVPPGAAALAKSSLGAPASVVAPVAAE